MGRNVNIIVSMLVVASALSGLGMVDASHPSTQCENKTAFHHYAGGLGAVVAINGAVYGHAAVHATDDNLSDCNGDTIPSDFDGDPETGVGGGVFPTAYWADVQGYGPPYAPCQGTDPWGHMPHHASGIDAAYWAIDASSGLPGLGIAWLAGVDGRLAMDDGSATDVFPLDPDHDGDGDPTTGPNYAGDNCRGGAAKGRKATA